MDVTVLLIIAGAIFLIGFAVGMRVEEINLKVREKALARGRRARNESQPPTDIEPPAPSVTTRPL